MLDWIMGVPRPEDEEDVDATRLMAEGDYSAIAALPETPAHIFAFRAFGTALFGTPQPTKRLPKPAELKDTDPITAAIEHQARAKSLATSNLSDAAAISSSTRSKVISLPSPSKGILITPGTVNARRKTVSFGSGISENSDRLVKEVGKTGIPDNCPGKFPSPFTPKIVAVSSQPVQRSLTKSLHDARSQTEVDGNEDNYDLGDVTLDLNEPQSGSGRYWKSEYEQYHEKMQEELRKLVKYRDLAKSFARKKDAEAMKFAEHLREERIKVSAMERQISELAALLGESHVSGEPMSEGAAKVMETLKMQITLALKYKQKVDQFEAALESQGPPANTATKRSSRQKTSSGEIHSRDQADKMQDLRVDLENMQKRLSGAEERAQTLTDEKDQLVKDLLSARKEFDRAEKKRADRELRRKQREENVEAQLQASKDRLARYREEAAQASQSLRALHSKELGNLKATITTMKAAADYSSTNLANQRDIQTKLQNKDMEIEQLKTRIKSLQLGATTSAEAEGNSEWQQKHRKTLHELREAREEASKFRAETVLLQEQLLNFQSQAVPQNANPAWTSSMIKDSDENNFSTRSTTKWNKELGSFILGEPLSSLKPRKPLEETPLREIDLNQGTIKSSRSKRITAPIPMEAKLRRQMMEQQVDSPQQNLPSLESTSVLATFSPQKRPISSHRFELDPSMWMPSSPPDMNNQDIPLFTSTAPMLRRTPTAKVQRTGNAGSPLDNRRIASSSSLRSKAKIPPDRLAAAKARLEQRNAEKRVRSQQI